MVYDIIVVGGGIVGLASSLKILRKNPKLNLLIIEKEKSVSQHQTGNNSGVIHSGLYYKPGSLKARNCIEGYNQLVQFCREEDIAHEICGKVVVATSKNELNALDTLFERGNQNGLKGLIRLNSKEALQEYEPHIHGIAGIFVPQTGIVNYKKVSEAYLKKIEALGGAIQFEQTVNSFSVKGNTSILKTSKEEFETKLVVNCGGLYSDKIARMTQKNIDLKIIPFRGEYYEISPQKSYLVKNLIYPVPDPNFPFLGVHFTRMIGGGVEAGPNAVLAYAREGYTKGDINVSEFFESLTWPGFIKVASKYWKTGLGELYRSYSKKAFTKALQKLIPEISESDLIPGGAGVRAQACDRNGGLLDDFMILDSKMAVNVCNAPSPAATSSLAIGDYVSDKVLEKIV